MLRQLGIQYSDLESFRDGREKIQTRCRGKNNIIENRLESTSTIPEKSPFSRNSSILAKQASLTETSDNYTSCIQVLTSLAAIKSWVLKTQSVKLLLDRSLRTTLRSSSQKSITFRRTDGRTSIWC